ALEEKQESWDLGSRIQWNGDFRFRADYLDADTPSHYTALDVARGVEWFTDPGTLDPFAGTIGDNTHTVAGSAGSTNGTAGLLYGFFLQTPTSPTAGNPTMSAGAAGGELGRILYGDPTAVTINIDGTGQMTGVVVDPNAVEQAATDKTQALVALMNNFTPAQRAMLFGMMGYTPDSATSYENDTIYTNRFRLNMRAKAMENLEFKTRLAMYKIWGMQNNAVDYTYNNGLGGGAFMLSSIAFDGSSTRQPEDNILRVDRAFMNWNNIGGKPFWFSIGRRPVTDGPPAHIRMGLDKKMATPVAYMDYPFDGLSLGYAYWNLFGIKDMPGRVRLCYGRGFEGGPTEDGGGINDVDFGGISWDVFNVGDRFLNFQSFGAFNMFNVPDNITFVNPIEFATWEDDNTQYNPLDPSKDLALNRANLGDIFHTSTVYMSKFQNLNYFLTLGWSRTKARGMDELGTSLLGSWWEEPEDRDGYSTLVGVRYDMDDIGLKLGAEYNWGSEYWIAFTPGHDDLYASKLATRGNVFEVYAVYDIPAGEKISKFSDAFFRLGYQHYEYDYTGSGFWLGKPQDIDELKNDPLNAQFYVPVESMDQVYLTMEAWF
ncbi:MAG: DUF3373 family protein, partial [Desulfobulbales bacterium]|nr:DUF3373 family protein [Desulfobulbales bacterium]